jgi:amidase
MWALPVDTNLFNITDNPALFSNQPLTIQVVARPFEDEELIQTASVIDSLLSGR